MSGGWLDDNETRRWPFTDDARVSDLPDDIIADLHVVYPDFLEGDLVLASISVGPSYCSFVLRVGDIDVAWYGDTPVPRMVVPLQPLVDGVSGTVTLGNGVTTWLGRIEPENALVAPEAAHTYLSQTFEQLFIQKAGSASIGLQGVVTLQAGASIDITQHTDVEVQTDDGPVTVPSGVEFSLNTPTGSTTMNAVSGHENRRVIMDNCDPDVVNYLSGVRPDAAGDLTLRIDGTIASVEILPAEVQLVTDLSATRECDNKEAVEDIPVTNPECD